MPTERMVFLLLRFELFFEFIGLVAICWVCRTSNKCVIMWLFLYKNIKAKQTDRQSYELNFIH